MVRTTGALGTEAVSVLAFAPLHCLHEMSTVFGGHQSADLLMMTVLFVTSAGGLDTEGAAVAVEVEFDLLDEGGLLVGDVIGGLAFLHRL